MSQKEIDKIVDTILHKVAVKIEQKYNIEQSEILSVIQNIPESLHCKYILVSGKRKGEVCNVILCDCHTVNVEDTRLASVIDESIMYANVNRVRKKLGIPLISPITHYAIT